MVKAGLIMNFTGIFVITLLFYLWGRFSLGIDFTSLPDWAMP
jgi:hypothetical protein